MDYNRSAGIFDWRVSAGIPGSIGSIIAHIGGLTSLFQQDLCVSVVF